MGDAGKANTVLITSANIVDVGVSWLGYGMAWHGTAGHGRAWQNMLQYLMLWYGMLRTL